jgi:hypothetical protein
MIISNDGLRQTRTKEVLKTVDKLQRGQQSTLVGTAYGAYGS